MVLVRRRAADLDPSLRVCRTEAGVPLFSLSATSSVGRCRAHAWAPRPADRSAWPLPFFLAGVVATGVLVLLFFDSMILRGGAA